MDENTSRIGEGSNSACRRYLTLVFSDLSDSTRLARTMESEHYGDMLRALRQVCRDVIAAHRGTLVRTQGDGMLAIFGHPEATEEDGRRATEAVIDLHDRVKALQIDSLPSSENGIELHSGIHSGLVLLDDGDLTLGRFDLFGDAPNVACRLSESARRGEILVSVETLGPARRFFLTSDPRRIELRGRGEGVEVVSVRGRAATPGGPIARSDVEPARFVGRQQELAILERYLQLAMSGQSQTVAISASPGIGKTRLAEEFLRRASSREWQVQRGYCDSDLGAEPLQPFHQMIRSICGLRHDMTADQAVAAFDQVLASFGLDDRTELLHAVSLLPDTRSAKATAPLDANRAVMALGEFFSMLASRAPLLVFIDDWQWADEATRQLVAYIRSIERKPVMVLLASRIGASGDALMHLVDRLPLAPLNDSEATAKIRELLPGVDPFQLEEIRDYAGGSPLFIEELCHSAADSRAAERQPGRLQVGAAWLDRLIESRLARLPANQVDLARAAAVIGNVIPLWLLKKVTGCSADDPRLRALATQDFIFPGEQAGTLRFKHAIARDAIYKAIGLQQRRALHLQIAEVLQQHAAGGEAWEALALHYAAAGRDAPAARYAELAGHKALAASALDRAKLQYRSALACLDRLKSPKQTYSRWISIAQKLGLACVFDASRDELAVFRRAYQLATEQADVAAIARALYWLGYLSYALGDLQASVRHGEQAQAWASVLKDEPLMVQIQATLGQAHHAMSAYPEALELLDRAISVKQSHRSGSRPAVGLAYSLACKACVLADRGRFNDAYECFDEALDAIGGANHEVEASTLGLRSAVLLWQGRWADARQCAADACRIGEQVRSLYSYAMSRAAGAYAGWMIDRDPAMLLLLADATQWLAPRGGCLFRSWNHGWLADGAVTSGHFEQVRGHAANALVQARRRDLLGVAMACRAVAVAAAQANDAARSAHYLALAMKIANRRDSAHERAATRLCEAGIALQFGERDRALRALDSAHTAFEAMAMPWHLAESRRLLGLL